MKNMLLLLFGISMLSCTSGANSQSTLSVDTVDSTLTSIYKKYQENKYDYGDTEGEGRDSILVRFQNTLERVLKDPAFAKAKYDSLSNYIKIRTSKDEKLKIFSWDELNVGTWRKYNAMYQFTSGDDLYVGALLYKNDDNERIPGTDVSHYKIDEIDPDKYLVKAYGSYGGGKEFYVFRLLQLENGEVKDCSGCFNGKDRFFYEIGRGRDELIPKYDVLEKKIRYHELAENYIDGDKASPSGFMDSTGNILILKYQDGKFIAIDKKKN